MIIKADYKNIYKVVFKAPMQIDIVLINANSEGHALELIIDLERRKELEIKTPKEEITISLLVEIDNVW